MQFCLESFLSEENIKLHKDYLENLKVKYSIYEACNKNITEKNPKTINSMRIGSDKNSIIDLKCRILCHELFFSSFCSPFSPSKAVKQKYGSEASFLYEAYCKGRALDCGYIILYRIKNNIDIYCGNAIADVFLKSTPILVMDVYEHSYFYDFGFDKESYLEKAFSYWNLSKVDKFLNINY